MLTPQASHTLASVVLVLEATLGSGPGSDYPEQWNLGAGGGQAWKSILANGKMELWTPPCLAPL